MGKNEKVKNVEKIVDKELDNLRVETDNFFNKKAENLRLIEKNLEELSNTLQYIKTYQQLQAEYLKSPIFKQLMTSWKYFVKEISPLTIFKVISGIGSEISLEVDEFGKDELFIEKIQPILNFLYEEYWRVEVEGIENIPYEGKAILVANHAGVLPFDSFMITEAVKRTHPFGRMPRFLIEDWFLTRPFVGIILQRYGMARGSQDNALRLLAKGELVGLFPEGMKGIFKTFSERYKLQRFGRGGAIRVAIKAKAPIIPVAVLGSEEIYPVIGHWDFLARILGLPLFPVTPFFPFLGILGTIPLPSKWIIKFGEPIPVQELPPETVENEIIVNTLNEELRSTIQEMLFELLKKRRSIFFG